IHHPRWQCGDGMAACGARAAEQRGAANRRADVGVRERPRISGIPHRIPRGTPKARMGGGSQYSARHPLGGARHRGDTTVREGTRRACPDLILSSSTFTTAALLQQTRTIPIIFANVVDPVGSGFVASLPRPGGNVTGFINLEPSMVGKWLELLKEI